MHFHSGAPNVTDNNNGFI